MLNVTSSNSVVQEDLHIDLSSFKKYGLDISERILDDHDYIVPQFVDLSENAENVITYISGYVIRMLKKRISCPECICSTLEVPEQNSSYKLIYRKNEGIFHVYVYNSI